MVQPRMKLVRWWRSVWFANYTTKFRRLEGTLTAYKYELERRIQAYQGENRAWIESSRELIGKCEHLLKEAKLDEAWKCFHEARRAVIFSYGVEELKNTAFVLREEAEKLSDWRRKAVYALLGRSGSPGGAPPTHDAVHRASLIRDEHYNNSYYKNQLTRIQFQVSFFALALFLILLWAYFRWWYTAVTEYINLLAGVLIFGLLGATTSTILFIRKSSRASRIPEILSHNLITLSRIFVGAAFSVFIFILLNTSLAGQIDLFSFKADTPLDFFALAFVTGFSERFVLNRITGIIGGDS